MVVLPVSPRRVFGVALSGADDAGAQTWVCRGYPGAEGVRVESVDRFESLPGGCTDREGVYRALVAKVIEAPRSAWGVDAPFAAHAELSQPRKTDRPGVEDPAGWAELAARVGAGLVAPLRNQPGVVVLPLDPVPVLPAGAPPAMVAQAPSTYVFEVGPEILLRRLCEAEADASSNVGGVAGRTAVLRRMVAESQVRPLPRALRTGIAEDERALDAVLCAVAAWRACRSSEHTALHADSAYRDEGYRYH